MKEPDPRPTGSPAPDSRADTRAGSQAAPASPPSADSTDVACNEHRDESCDAASEIGSESAYDVVLVTLNHAETLPATLAAVAALEPRPRSVILLDNASSDGSARLATRLATESAAPVPLEVIRESTNTGFAAAVNRGLRACSSDWALLLNPDCAPRPDFVLRLLRAVARHPEAARIGSATGRLIRGAGAVLEPDGVLDAAGMVVTSSGRHHDRGAGEPDDGRYARQALVFGGTGAALLLRRSALADVCYPGDEVLAESFFAYREDAELAWRLQWRGWHCLYVPTAVAVHRRHLRPEVGRGTSRTRGPDKAPPAEARFSRSIAARSSRSINALSVRNRFLLRLHCADLGWHLRCFPWWLVRDLLVIGACLTVERSSRAALIEVWRTRHDAIAHRRHVLDRARVRSRQVSRWFRIKGRVEEQEAPERDRPESDRPERDREMEQRA